jgi:hypothetical protein
MLRFRRLLIFGVNVLTLLWLLKVIYLDPASDTVGLFGIATLVFLVVYNLYAALVYIFFPTTKHLTSWLEGAFIGVLSLPFALLYIFTS